MCGGNAIASDWGGTPCSTFGSIGPLLVALAATGKCSLLRRCTDDSDANYFVTHRLGSVSRERRINVRNSEVTANRTWRGHLRYLTSHFVLLCRASVRLFWPWNCERQSRVLVVAAGGEKSHGGYATPSSPPAQRGMA